MTQTRHPVSTREVAWLDQQLRTWVAEGLVTDETGTAIRARYVATRTSRLSRLLLYLGSAFVGVGLIWLVASNLDELSPLARFIAVMVLWLGVTAVAEFLADRRQHLEVAVASPVAGALRGLSAIGSGAVVFQAAQSLQVPAYEPGLLAAWGVGALLYAYASAGVASLVVGVSATTGWLVWHSVEQVESVAGVVIALVVGSVIASAVAALHDARWRPAFAETWRAAGALLLLIGLFVAALPWFRDEGISWNATLLVSLALAVVLSVAAMAVGRGSVRVEVAVPLVALPLAALLTLWQPSVPDDGLVSGEALLSAVVSVGVYVTAAGTLAVIGSLRDSRLLVGVATAALVVFTTVQGFAVFAPIFSGAVLFLFLGAVLLATGYFFDRARRRVAGAFEAESS